MRVILSPVGSAGDIHPFVGLGAALQDRGHEVLFVTNGHFRPLVERVQLEYVELGTEQDYEDLTAHPDLWHPRKAFSYICRQGVARFLREQYNLLLNLYRADDSIVVSSCLGFGARIAQEAERIRLVTVHLQPAVLWSKFESPVLPMMPHGKGVPRWLKQALFRLGERMVIDKVTREVTDDFRRELNLPPIQRTTEWWHSTDAILCLFPDWYAPLQPDWPPHLKTTQFPLWDESEVTPLCPELQQFLAAGEPPIVFTPGSAMRYGRQFFEAACDACERLSRRGLLLSPYRDQLPATLPSNVGHFDYIPFSQVLPGAAAIVHHGGIGTTSQALCAGIPQLIMPMAHDQPDNAARLKRLGVGDWLVPAKFHGMALARKLATLLDSSRVADNCQMLATRVREQRGLDTSCEFIEQAQKGAKAPRISR